MVHYYQTGARKTCAKSAGELAWCEVFVAEYPEQETGYIDERAICADCWPEREAYGRDGTRISRAPA